MIAAWRREAAWMAAGALATGLATALSQWLIDEAKEWLKKRREEEAESKRLREEIGG